MNQPLFSIEHWPHGLSISSTQPSGGVPLDAIKEAGLLLPPEPMIDSGIASHLRRSGKLPKVVFCAGSDVELKLWRNEIEAECAKMPCEQAWWMGCDTGLSSQTIFMVLSTDKTCVPNWRENGGKTPQDASDFARCARLLAKFPDWRKRLPEVAARWPATKWPAIVERWDELAALDSPTKCKELSRKLREINA